MKTYLILDYETFSEAEIKLVGGWEYSRHPSTEILCAAFKLGTREELPRAKTHLWIPNNPATPFGVFLRALRDPNIELVAHNAIFEQMITRNVFGRNHMPSKPEIRSIPVERWHCTAAMSRSVGLPGSLEGAGAAFGLSHQKDKEGHKLMLKVCKPKKPSKKDKSTRYTDPEMLQRLFDYCVKDVEAETELFLKLPPLHEKERRFWVLNQKLNLRGFHVDRKLAKSALKLIAHETEKMDAQVKILTDGQIDSARQRDEVLKFLKREGMVLPNLKAQTVRETLEAGKFPTKKAERILQIRDTIARSSTAKYKAFEMRSRDDGRARDNTIFFGAHTGRDAGTGLQPQNLFKRVMTQAEVDLGSKLIRLQDRHTIEALFQKPMELYASALRGCIVPAPGNILEVGDFATIEVRVLFWLAGHQNGLDALSSGRDLYIEMAAKIFRLDPKKLLLAYKTGDKDAAFMRQLGKQTVLGSGFGMGLGGEKFQATCKQYDMEIELELAKTAIRAYRELHPRIPIFWGNLERAAIQAFQNPGKRYRLGYLIWERKGDFLTVELPIGRKLSYFKPRVDSERGPWGNRQILSYMGVLSPSKKFGRVKTWGGKLTENVVQAVARDLLYEALDRLESSGSRLPVLPVHDEVVGERSADTGHLDEFISIMSEVPAWAKGLPIKVEGWSEKRYRK
jgi:DNA polymerase